MESSGSIYIFSSQSIFFNEKNRKFIYTKREEKQFLTDENDSILTDNYHEKISLDKNFSKMITQIESHQIKWKEKRTKMQIRHGDGQTNDK